MQAYIFDEPKTNELTINQAAKVANVSIATIRNWIKAGYLTTSGKGKVAQASLDKFMTEVAGVNKLKARANKLLKDKHNHQAVTDNINFLIKNYTDEQIGIAYERSLSDSHRNKEGIYYTPTWVVKDMFKNVKISSTFTFLDPCCGSGNFVIEAIRQGVAPENVYGFDTDENAVLITQQRIKDEFGFETNNIRVGNFLEEAHQQKLKKVFFDLIFTNPPWGKKIEKSAKQKYSAIYGCGNSLDTTSLFLGASLSILKPNGFLGFLIQEAFFNISTFEDIRKKAASKKIFRLVDYGKAFKGLVTKAQAIIIENKNYNFNDLITCEIEGITYTRTIDSFKQNPKHIFNFWTDEEEAAVIKQLFSVEHTTLKNRAHWALGIVTGNNEKYCTPEPNEGYIPVFKGSDITKKGLKEPSIFMVNDFSKFQQVAPLAMYQSDEKIIYKFISSNLCFYYDTQQRYILNSANMLIPQNLGITAEQLTLLLNTEIMNWLFKKLFSTHKVLRGDLELLPIHTGFFSTTDKFTEESYLNYLQITQTSNGTYWVGS